VPVSTLGINDDWVQAFWHLVFFSSLCSKTDLRIFSEY
jgi:hypothetical protein